MLKLVTRTADVLLMDRGSAAPVILAMDAFTDKAGAVRIVAELSPNQALELATELLHKGRRGLPA